MKKNEILKKNGSYPLQGHETGSHHSQQTNTGAENKTLYILTHKWELNSENTWTQGREHHTLGPVGGWGPRGGRVLEQTPNARGA